MVSMFITVLSAWNVLLLGYNVLLMRDDQAKLNETAVWRRRGVQVGLIILLIFATFAPAMHAAHFHSSSAIGSKIVAKLPLSTAFGIFELLPGATSSFQSFVTMTAVSALYNGFFGTPAPFDVTCPSGNCVWKDAYTTLALCSKCTNLTNILEPLDDGQGNAIGLVLPNGFSLRYNANQGLPIGERQMYVNMNATATVFGSPPALKALEPESIAYLDMPGKLNDIFVIVGSDSRAAYHMAEAPEPAAYECALQWCLQQSTAKMVDGVLTETLTNVINDTTVDVQDPERKLSRQLKDPQTNMLYNVSSHSEFMMSHMLAVMLNGTRTANITGDAVPLTALWSAVARPEDSPADLFKYLASTITTFMRTNNSAILLANYSTAEGVATNHLATASPGSWIFLVYPLMVLTALGLLALAASSRPRKSVQLEVSSSLLHSEKQESY